MVGTQKWSMEEILWVITMVKQGLKDEEIYEKFCELFKNARHVKGASSIKYCRTVFMKQEEYSQEKYWEDAPGKIGFVLGRHDAGVYNGQIVADVMQHFPAHIWAPHVRPTAKCIGFTDYTRENPLVEPVIRLSTEGVSPEEIFKTANENGISLDDIYYIMARFWLEVKLYPTAFDYGLHSGASSSGSTSQAAPGTLKTGPLIFQLSPKPLHKKPKAEGSHHNSRRPSNTGSRVSHHSHGHEFFGWAGIQMTRRGVQQNVETSLLNSGYPQGISPGASQEQLHGPLRRPRPELPEPSQLHDMRFRYGNIQQGIQQLHQMAQLGGLNQQNWGHESTFSNQQMVPEQPHNSFGSYQQEGGQQIYGSSSQAAQISYLPQPGHHLMRAFNLHPQQFLAQEHQQPAVSLTSYENIDPALLGMDANQPSGSSTRTLSLSQPPLTPRIAPQDFLHPFTYSGAQSGQDISPLTIENPQFPVHLPPSPEVVHGEFEHRGQLTRPDPFAQRSMLTEYPQSGLGADSHQSSGMNDLDRDDFDLALTLSDYNNAVTPGHENTRESGHSAWDAIDHSDGKINTEGSSTEHAGQGSTKNSTPVLLTTNEEEVAGSPITNQEPLSETQLMEWDGVEEATNFGDLSELFPDLEHQSSLGFNFNYDGSIIGGGDINHSGNDAPGNGPQDKLACDAKYSLEAMEAVSRDLETRMAGPILTQNLIEDNNDSGGVQCSNSRVFEDDWAPEGTCCAHHQNFECYFEVPDGEDATVSKC
ncbi:hypothetical protein V495_07675 [Pseudogymnoascus sp. VKM F-4514 (FW-929)]|nr:hypothetical protein V495_07675 [Pseudogymnoascus sp. VKM F-4514 (FW-929)]KFY61532.1 hypothetical protein V497_02906 [Pseudogymnoascus sp. VKM F-4516 (FW-969)]